MSRVVFVGNIPYNFSEEQLIQVFSTVGAVVGFRLVFERESGRQKGYGFCEYLDHETAQSAVRNLNGKEVGGRPLRIDLADSDPLLEGKSTSFGELLDDDHAKPVAHNSTESWLSNLPQGVPIPPGQSSLDVITHAVATLKQDQLLEALYDMKNFLLQNPDRARILLVANPQLALAVIQALIVHSMVDPSTISRLQDVVDEKPVNGLPAPPPSWQNAPTPYYSQPPPPPPVSAPPPSNNPEALLDPQQQAMLMQVLSLTNDQINALPAGERDAILALRNQFMAGS